MRFILNEKEYALWLLENGTLGKSEKISIRILLKYYRALGYAKTEAIEELLEFMALNLSYFKQHDWMTLIENLATLVYEQEQDLVMVERVVVTKREMAAIQSTSSFVEQKVLFCLLIYKKVQNAISKQENEWFSGSLGEIFRMARAGGKRSTTEAQYRMIYRFKEAGLVTLAKRLKSTNLKLEYLELGEVAPEDVVLVVEDFADVIYDFCKYSNKRVIRCQTCGKMVTLKKNERMHRKYCETCRKIAVNEKSLRYYYRTK